MASILKVPDLEDTSQNATWGMQTPTIYVPIVSLRLEMSLTSQEPMSNCAQLQVF